MSQCFQSTDGFIKLLFGPRVAVLCSQDAEILSRRNNLSFAELIRPFCSINSEIQVRDPAGQPYPIRDLHVTICDLRCKVPDEKAIEQMLSEVVRDVSSLPETSKTLNFDSERYQVNVSMSCPWFETYRDLLTSLAPQKLHEFINHCLSCLLVVSSSHPSPIEEFAKLSQHQNFIQHNSQQTSPIRWMTPNTLKYYVLLHDNSNADIEKARSVMNDLQGMYGFGACHLLRINSKLKDDDQQLPDPWGRFLNNKPVIPNTEPNGITMNDAKVQDSLNVDPVTVSTDIQASQSWVKELKAAAVIPQKGYGCCLTLSDHDNLRMFMQEFASKGLLTHVEKLIRTFHEQISSRKAIHRSFFRVTKTFFGGNKAASAPALKNYGSGGLESPELQVRKLADLFFLCQMYEQAYGYYHSIKKDFSNEQAWLHAAGASEMAALSNFMQLRAQRTYPAHYVDTAIDTYLNNSTDPYLVVRCALVSLECLRTQGMYAEAASQLKKLTSGNNDLQCAIMWEQVAQCYLRLKKPLLRKFAFYILLAGHRYQLASQHHCAVMCYQNALQVYGETGWDLAIDFINFTIGKLLHQLKEYEKSSYAFQRLLKESNQTTHQQTLHLQEYLGMTEFYHRKYETIADLTIPEIMHNDIVIRNSELATHLLKGKNWNFMEEALRSVRFQNSIPLSNSATFIAAKPNVFEAVVNEPMWIDITMDNPLKLALAVDDASLLFDFDPAVQGADVKVNCPPVTDFILAESSKSVLSFCILPQSSGQLHLLGLTYTLSIAKSTSSQMSTSKIDLTGRQMFKGADLTVNVGPAMPKLDVVLDDNAPKVMCGEMRPVKVVLSNVGQRSLKNVKVAFDCTNIFFTLPDYSLHKVQEHFLKQASEITSSSYCAVQNLREENLGQGEQMELLLWIHAPSIEGRETLSFMFNYEPEKAEVGQTRSRSLKYTIDLYTRQSLSLNATVNKDNSHQGALLVVEVSNSGLSDSINLEKLLCSSSSWAVSSLTPVPSSHLEVGQATTVYFSVNDKYFVDANVNEFQCLKLDGSGDNSSANATKFLQLCTYNKSGKILSPPVIDYLAMAIQWFAKSDKNTVLGQHYVYLPELKSNTDSLEKIGLSLDSDVMIDSSQSLVALHHLVKWKFAVPHSHKHDFQHSGMCFVPVQIILQNQYNCELRISVNGLDLNQTQNIGNPAANTRFFWTGKSLSKLIMQPKQCYTVHMQACFSAPGVYNINSFGVWAVPLKIEGKTPLLPQSCSYSCLVTILDT